MSNTEKIYIGNGTEKFDGGLVEFSLNLSKLSSEAKDHFFEYNGEKFIKLKVVKKRDQYGKTHYVEVDTYKPEAKAEDKTDDLPF